MHAILLNHTKDYVRVLQGSMFEEDGGYPVRLAEQNITPHSDFSDEEGLHSSGNESINLGDDERGSGV